MHGQEGTRICPRGSRGTTAGGWMRPPRSRRFSGCCSAWKRDDECRCGKNQREPRADLDGSAMRALKLLKLTGPSKDGTWFATRGPARCANVQGRLTVFLHQPNLSNSDRTRCPPGPNDFQAPETCPHAQRTRPGAAQISAESARQVEAQT